MDLFHRRRHLIDDIEDVSEEDDRPVVFVLHRLINSFCRYILPYPDKVSKVILKGSARKPFQGENRSRGQSGDR